MQIQRLQTLWLAIAVICGTVSFFTPWWSAGSMTMTPASDMMLLILCSLATILPLLAIFMFRNMRRQKQVALLGAAMSVLAIGYSIAMTYMPDSGGVEITQHFGTIWPAASALADIMARRCIVSDEKLLRSADRLR